MSASVATPDSNAGARSIERRRQRWELKRYQQVHSSIRRVQACGSRRIDSNKPVLLSKGPTGCAHVSNIARCGSLWACPVCLPKVRQARAEEINAGVSGFLEQGGFVLMVSVTLPHDPSDRLAALWDAVTGSWRAVWAGRAAQAQKRSYGFVGTIKATETTRGVNGWHPHHHNLLLFERELSSIEVQLLEEWIYERWAAAVQSYGFRRPTRANGIDVRQVRSAGELGDYLQKVEGKQNAHLELARPDLKSGRWESMTPWEILARAAETNDEELLRLWREFEQASKGRNALTWSPGLKARLGVGEVTDVELAEAPVVEAVAQVAMPIGTWGWLMRRRFMVTTALERVETDGARATVQWLARAGQVGWLPETWPDQLADTG